MKCKWEIPAIALILLFMVIFSLEVSAHPTDKRDHGFLKTDGRMWVFEDGTAFIPIGISLGGIAYLTKANEFEQKWGMTPDEFFDTLAENGANYVAAHTHMAEWVNYPEFIQYHRAHLAKNLDWFLTKLEQNGQYTTITLTHHAEHKTDGLWPWNKYNKSQGGPCESPNDFVTNAEARAKMKEKIDFFNRFSVYRSFGVWQLSTEWVIGYADGEQPNFRNQATVDWHVEMADYIHEIDENHHPVSGNLYWRDYQDEAVPDGPVYGWKEPNTRSWGNLYKDLLGHSSIDYVNIHIYGLDIGYAVEDFCNYNKPILVTESAAQLFERNQQPKEWVVDGIDFLQYLTWSALALWTSSPDWSLWRVANGSGEESPLDLDMFGHFEEYLGVFRAASTFAHNVLIPDGNNWSRWPELWHDKMSGNGRIYASGDPNRVMAYIRDSSGTYTVWGVNNQKYRVAWYNPENGELISSEFLEGNFLTSRSPGGHVMLYIKSEDVELSQ